MVSTYNNTGTKTKQYCLTQIKQRTIYCTESFLSWSCTSLRGLYTYDQIVAFYVAISKFIRVFPKQGIWQIPLQLKNNILQYLRPFTSVKALLNAICNQEGSQSSAFSRNTQNILPSTCMSLYNHRRHGIQLSTIQQLKTMLTVII